MQAYLGDEALKAKTIAAMEDDIKAERLVQGKYWDERNNGCFVGCVIRGNSHIKFEIQLGIPRLLAILSDRIFEGLTYENAKQFSVDFLQAIKSGSDLSSVWPKFAVFMLIDKDHGVINFVKKNSTKKSIQDVANLYQRIINGEKIDANVWLKARRNAYADAARAAADAYADADADAYADAARAYAAYADAADAAAADAAAARARHFAARAAVLVKFLGEAQ